jgi:hypothetical protein
MLTLPEINEVLARYGRDELDVDAAVAALRGELPSVLMAARTTRVLTPEQYLRLGSAVQVATTGESEPPEEESQPGGDAYHHHVTPTPPGAYLNPGAPVIPERYRNPGRRCSPPCASGST